MFKNIGLIILIILSASCSSEKLNGHFHLEFEDSKNFQIWNIKNNRMRMNVPDCEVRDDNCFSSQISFRGNKMLVRPWYDIDYLCEYSIDENGTVTMDDGKSVMRLVPHSNCTTNEEYFSEKTKNYTNSFQLLDEVMTGEVALPTEKENELIIIRRRNKQSQLLFNGKTIQNIEEIPTTQNESIWLHIDKRVEVGDIIPILKHLNQNGYKHYFSALSKNPEQIRLLGRNIESINSTDEGFEIDICQFCERHIVSRVDSILEVKILEPEKYFIQEDTVSSFQTRNRISRYLGKNRTTILNTQIQFTIPEKTTFETYLRLIDEMNFVHIELTDIIEYRGKNDKDLEAIKNNDIIRKKEFPIRIKEIIKKKIIKNNK